MNFICITYYKNPFQIKIQQLQSMQPGKVYDSPHSRIKRGRNSPASNYRSHPHQASRYQSGSSSIGGRQYEEQESHFEEQSSTIYHMHEEIRLLKLKNCHLQQHMDRMQLEYSQLHKTIEYLQVNQKQQLRRNNDLMHRLSGQHNKMLELNNEISMLRFQNDGFKNENKITKLREEELRKRIQKSKQKEFTLLTKIQELQDLNSQLELKLSEKQRLMERTTKKTGNSQANIKQLNQQIQRLNDSEKYHITLNKQLQETLQQWKDKLKASEKQKQQLVTANEKLKNEIVEFQNQITALRHKIEIIQQQEKCRKRYLQQKQVIIVKYQHQIKQIMQKALQKQQADKEKEGHRQKLQNENDQLKNKIQMLERQVEEPKHEKNQKFLSSVQILPLTIDPSSYRNQDQNQIQSILKIPENSGLGQGQQKNQKLIAQLQQKVTQLQNKLDGAQKNYQLSKERQKSGHNNESKQQTDKVKRGQNQSLSQLQLQYNNELQALRRLIVYKQYTSQPLIQSQTPVSKNEERIRQEYQNKIDTLVRDYQLLQKELLTLQQEVVNRHYTSNINSLRNNNSDGYNCEVITFRTSEEQRDLYIKAIRKWQMAYQQQQAIYQAKIISKEQQINLLNLKLTNSGF